MAQQTALAAAQSAPDGELIRRWPASAIWREGEPAIRTIGLQDLKDALRLGLDDFRAMPTHLAFLAVIYPVIGLVLGSVLVNHDAFALIYPKFTGLALFGAASAIGLYEMSRRREAGLEATPAHAFDVLHSQSSGPMIRLTIVLVGLFLLWIWMAKSMFVSLAGGTMPVSFDELRQAVFNTAGGRQLIVMGNLVGALFAVAALMISAVSFPLLVDRHASAATAVRTSIRACIQNPVTMAVWGLIVVAGLLIGTLPLFAGLAVTIPVLGHATWHLYRKVVSPTETIA